MRIHLLRGLAVLAAATMGVSAVSCGGGGGAPTMVLVGFNLPNIAGVALNQPLVWTYSDLVDPATVTPDTVQVVGTPAFTFEKIVVDQNLVAMLPSVPNFEDYSDSGLKAGTTYTVFMPVLPSVDTVRSLSGRPLVIAETFNFTTVPIPAFIEARRPIVHTSGPPLGMGDEDGCVNNANNEFFNLPPPSVFQFGTDADALLLCLKNEGPPRILASLCSPIHNQRGVGTPSASAPGTVDMGAIQILWNEPLDPVSVVPYVPTTQLSVNVQLWQVGDTDANAITPRQVQTTKPLVVQNTTLIKVILSPTLPQSQGTYLVNVQGCKDLAGNLMDEVGEKNASVGGYTACDNNLVGKVPPGYRLYFRTLVLPATNGSFGEAFDSNFAEGVGDVSGGGHGTRTFTQTSGLSLVTAIPGTLPQPGILLTNAQPGQSTTANWNGTNRGLGLPNWTLNDFVDDGTGRLKAVFQPYLGTGGDGDLLVNGSTTISSAPDVLHPNGRIWEFNSLTINAGATLTLLGDRPVLILVRQAFVNNGAIVADGDKGRWGLDSDGTYNYTHVLTPAIGGPGGTSGPGGGAGGHGSPKIVLPNGGDAAVGIGGSSLFTTGYTPIDPQYDPPLGAPSIALSGDTTNVGGGGGGNGTAGGNGSVGGTDGGSAFGDANFSRALARFVPDRLFQPNCNIAGGAGGGGGGGEDDSVVAGVQSETGDGLVSQAGADDGGGGGGGGGGAMWIMADTISVGATASFSAKGGRGGNTYGPLQQSSVNPDGLPDGGANPNDAYVTGISVADTTAGTGQGAGGGGGAGGSILLQGRTSVTLAAGSAFNVTGGAGGTAAGGKTGGAGGNGRIAIVASILGSFTNSGAVITPVGALGLSGATWQPTVDTISQGVSSWYDLTTPTADFKQPFFLSNFGDLVAAPYSKVRGLANDFEAIFEVQGADGLTPTAVDPTAATGGLTAWTPITFTVPPAAPATMATIDNKRFVRWRWRFFVKTGWDQTTIPLPQIFDFTLPFQK